MDNHPYNNTRINTLILISYLVLLECTSCDSTDVVKLQNNLETQNVSGTYLKFILFTAESVLNILIVNFNNK